MKSKTLVLWMVLALALPGIGWAATITVTSTADAVNDADGTCTLREAIRAANSNTAVDACTAGSGTDEIVFAASTNGTAITLRVSGTDDTAAAGDLDLTQSVNITGNGPANTLIEACTVDQKTAACPGGQGIADRVFHIVSGTVIVSISGVTIRNGGRVQLGGGILNRGPLTFDRSTLRGGTLTLTNTTLSNNTADDGGGIFNLGTLTVNTSTLSGNRAASGGGISNFNATSTLTNTTLSNNTADDGNPNTADTGGGIFNTFNATSTLTNTTLSNNSATTNGGGFDNFFGTFNLKNTIVANNSAPTGPDCRGSVTSQGNNLIENPINCFGFGGTDLTDQDPTLGPLADNGGPTQTHALLTASPAIDAGTNTGCPATDQRGVARPQDGDGDTTAVCDIGAYEVGAADADGDGFIVSDDCDDTDASIHPGATELCNGADDNCNTTVDEGFDVGASCIVGPGACQQTGTKVCTTDGLATECSATPGIPSPETCNNIDDDCDGAVDESPTNPLQPLSQSCYSGPAGTQGVGVCQAGTQSCSGGSFGACEGEVTPSAEVCDGQDNNCDGQTDEGVTSTFYQDADGDGFGNSASSTQACSAPAGYVSNSTDCNDANAAVHPGASEVCNGVDDDCNGEVDARGLLPLTQSCYNGPAGTQGVGVCQAGTQSCSGGSFGACVGEVTPSAEVCDGQNNDCDGQTDEGVTSTFYQDADSDGFGNSASSTQACSAPAGYVSNSTDCNDANTAIHPGATEVCDGVDNDCDGTADDSPSDAGLGCTTGLPGVCSAGTTVCSSNGTLICNQTFQPSAEVCGDGIDQDCDGQDVDCITQAITLTDDLIADVQSLQIDKGTKNSLLAKLNAAQSSLEKGNTAAAEGQLTAFINEVSAQRGKKIPAAEADALIAQARAIIAILP